MPSRSKRALSVPQRSSPRLVHHPTNSAESTPERGQKRPLPWSNGVDDKWRRKSLRLQLPDICKKNNQPTTDIGRKVLQKQSQDVDRRREQRGSQKMRNINGDVSNLKDANDSEVCVSTADCWNSLNHQKQVDGSKHDHPSEDGNRRKNSLLESEKAKEGSESTTSSDQRYPARKCQDEEDSPYRQRYPSWRISSQGDSKKENDSTNSSSIEKREVPKGLKTTRKLPSPEPVFEDSFPLVQWLPSPVVIGFGFEKDSYNCLNCALEFSSLRSFIHHCIPTSKVPCYICGEAADSVCKERIHHLWEHQFVCFFCPERFATPTAAKHHIRIVHPNKPERTSPKQQLTFHGKPPIDLMNLEKPSVSTFIIILGKFKRAKRLSSPWICGAKDSASPFTKIGIVGQCEKFLYGMNEAMISDALRKRAVMCPLCLQGFTSFESVEAHMVDIHRPNSLKEFKPSVKRVASLTTTGPPSFISGTTPVSSSASSSQLGSKTTPSTFCNQCQKVFQDETSLGRHTVIAHSLSTVHRKALAQKAREDVTYDVTLHICSTCKVPFSSEKSMRRHIILSHGDISVDPKVANKTNLNPTLASSSKEQVACSGNVKHNKHVQEQRHSPFEDKVPERSNTTVVTSSGDCKENVGPVICKGSQEMGQSEHLKDNQTISDSKKRDKDSSDSAHSKRTGGPTLKSNPAHKVHTNIVKSRKSEYPTSSSSWYLPKALFSLTTLRNATPSVIAEVDKLIQEALDLFAVEKETNLRAPHATAARYKFSRATAAYLKLKPVLQNPPQTPTARRNYEFNHKYEIPMGHMNPEFASFPLFPTLTDIFRRTDAYTMSPLRVLTAQEIKKTVPMSSRKKGKIAKRFSKALESAFMSETERCISKLARGHANVSQAASMQAHNYLSGRVSSILNERINKAIIRESQHQFSTGHLRGTMALNGTPVNSNQQHGPFPSGSRMPGPYHVLRGTPLQGQGMFSTIPGNLPPQGKYFEMPLGNNRALFSVNAQGLATVVGLIPGPRKLPAAGSPPRTLPMGYNTGSVLLPHTAAHGTTTSLNRQVPVSNPHISNPVNPYFRTPVHPSAIPGRNLPVVKSSLSLHGSSILLPPVPSQPGGLPPLVDLTKSQSSGYRIETVKEQLEKKRAAVTKEKLQETEQQAKVQETVVSTEASTSASDTVTSTRGDVPLIQLKRQLDSCKTNSGGSQTAKSVTKDELASSLKRLHRHPSPGRSPPRKKIRKVLVIPAKGGRKLSGKDIFRRNVGKKIVEIKRKRRPSSDWLVNQLHARMSAEANIAKKKIWLQEKYKEAFVPTKDIKPVALHTKGIRSKARDVNAVVTISEAVQRAKTATIRLDDFEKLCEKFALYCSSNE